MENIHRGSKKCWIDGTVYVRTREFGKARARPIQGSRLLELLAPFTLTPRVRKAKPLNKELLRRIRDLWWRLYDPRLVAERRGDRVVFRHLEASKKLAGLAGKRILEIGPKHGEDTVLLSGLSPRELVLLDLPNKSEVVRSWLAGIESPVRHLEGDLLELPETTLKELGTFELVWCLGVLYHNAEQLRLIKRLFQLTAEGGLVVVESATTRTHHLEHENLVEIHWPNRYRGVRTVSHLPTRRAIKSWMEMAGFSAVAVEDVYSRELGWQRAVLTGNRTADAMPYRGYDEPE
jgi:SAM-dependent methyltransferase